MCDFCAEGFSYQSPPVDLVARVSAPGGVVSFSQAASDASWDRLLRRGPVFVNSATRLFPMVVFVEFQHVAVNLAAGSAIYVRDAKYGDACDHLAAECGLRSMQAPDGDRLYEVTSTIDRLRELMGELVVRQYGRELIVDKHYARFNAVRNARGEVDYEPRVDWGRSKRPRGEFLSLWDHVLEEGRK